MKEGGVGKMEDYQVRRQKNFRGASKASISTMTMHRSRFCTHISRAA